MLDVATFEQDVISAADERMVDVIEKLIDRMLAITPDDDANGCSYAAYLDSYVRTRMIIRKLGFNMEFYWEDERPQGQYTPEYTRVPQVNRHGVPNGSFVIAKQTPASHFAQRIRELMPRMEEAHTKMYANPCKTCTTCQTRRKSWPILTSPLS